MNRPGLKIAIPFLCLLYCFAFFEIDLPGYTQTFHDTFDTYVHQPQQDDASPSQVYQSNDFLLPLGFFVPPRQALLFYLTPFLAETGAFSPTKLYLHHAVLLI